MPYDRKETIAAFYDYYDFLKKMYMPDDAVLYPPSEGWPEITEESFSIYGKTHEVIELLRHLPYPDPDKGEMLAGPAVGDYMYFLNYCHEKAHIERNPSPGYRIVFQGAFHPAEPHQVGLTGGDRNASQVLLDTESGEVRDAMQGQISKPSDSMKNYLAYCKEKFRTLEWVPISEAKVEITEGHYEDGKKMVEDLRECYRRHGWPDQAGFNKAKCREEKRAVMRKYREERDMMGIYFPEAKQLQKR